MTSYITCLALGTLESSFGYSVWAVRWQYFKRINFCDRVPWLYQYWPDGFMLFVVLCPGTPEGSTCSGSGFKASQKTGQRLKVSSDRLTFKGMLLSKALTCMNFFLYKQKWLFFYHGDGYLWL